MNWIRLDEFLHSYYEFYKRQHPKIYVSRDGLIPSHINQNVKYTEFHLKRDSDSLLITIGESWTFGESLPGIKTPKSEYNLQTLLTLTFGSRLYEILDCDWYQYAVPGNCNLFMYTELDRILDYVSTLNYKKIYICINLTENTREMNITGHKIFKNHAINNLFNDGIKRTIQEWVVDYENIWLDHLENSLARFKKDYSAILWRNFTKSNTNKIYKNFKQLDIPWPEYSAKLEGKILPMPAISNFPRMDEFITEGKNNVIMDRDWFESEMSLQENVAEFIRQSYYHNNHPNEFGHLAWAIYIAKKAGWANV